jgi:hypothetical protein
MLTKQEAENITVRQALERGMVSFNRMLYLIRADDYENWPDGVTLVSTMGDRRVKGVDQIDLTVNERGLLSYGIYPKPSKYSMIRIPSCDPIIVCDTLDILDSQGHKLVQLIPCSEGREYFALTKKK